MTAENTAGAVSHRCVSAPSAYRKGDTGWQMGQGESLATSAHLRNRVPKGAFERLERHKWKHLRAVLRGLGGSNAPRLPGEGRRNAPFLPGSAAINRVKAKLVELGIDRNVVL